MIKGCHKSIVFLKDTGSELFDEAYFIVKPEAKSKSKQDIVYEATRLVSDFADGSTQKRKSKGKRLSFLLGGLFGAGIMLIVHFIII